MTNLAINAHSVKKILRLIKLILKQQMKLKKKPIKQYTSLTSLLSMVLSVVLNVGMRKMGLNFGSSPSDRMEKIQ